MTQCIEIPLTRGQIALVDAGDYEKLIHNKWHLRKGGRTFYANRNATAKERRMGFPSSITMHRTILECITDISFEVDHINHNGLDNRRSNLRLCSKSQNGANRPKLLNNKSGYKGVHWERSTRSWRAKVRVNDKIYFQGRFAQAVDAARAYDAAAYEQWKEYAQLNFPEERA